MKPSVTPQSDTIRHTETMRIESDNHSVNNEVSIFLLGPDQQKDRTNTHSSE